MVRLEQALSNLVDNALRHGSGAVKLTASSTDGGAEVHVQDEGSGFPRAFHERAFERFSRAERSRAGDGAGLGLAIVRAIVSAHDGSVEAINLPGGGADVMMRLPA